MECVGGGGNCLGEIFQRYTSKAVTAVATATATWYSDILLQSSTTKACQATLLPLLRCLINSIRRLQENINLKPQTK
jgi:hypothetical protein